MCRLRWPWWPSSLRIQRQSHSFDRRFVTRVGVGTSGQTLMAYGAAETLPGQGGPRADLGRILEQGEWARPTLFQQ